MRTRYVGFPGVPLRLLELLRGMKTPAFLAASVAVVSITAVVMVFAPNRRVEAQCCASTLPVGETW